MDETQLKLQLDEAQAASDQAMKRPEVQALASVFVLAPPAPPKRKRRSDAGRPRTPTLAEEVAATLAKDGGMSDSIAEFMRLSKRRQELKASLVECEQKPKRLLDDPDVRELAKAIAAIEPKTQFRGPIVPGVVSYGFDPGGTT